MKQTGLLLVNLGTPDAPTPPALRRYLAEFLSDRRVIEIPRLIWWPILHGIILNTRPAKSARKYASVWINGAEGGSPLLVHTRDLGVRLQAALPDIQVRIAMRYGKPSVAQGLAELRDAGCQHIVVLPLYPQYSATTSGTVYDAVFDALKTWRDLPQIEIIRDYHAHPAYIEALATQVEAHWAEHGRGDRLLMSFHGLPQRSADLGDPYPQECHATAQRLATRLGLNDDAWQVSFQSRFGPAAWLQPYTDAALAQLAKNNCRRVDVICPGFAADCLETLEEIALEGRATFLANGGKEFFYIQSLNATDAATEAILAVVAMSLPPSHGT
jgi:ferrochelatase